MILLLLLIDFSTSSQNIFHTQQVGWSSDIAIANGLTSYPNQHNITCDTYGNIYTTWFSWSNSTVGYKRYAQNTWTNDTIFPAAWMTGYSSIAANKTGSDIYICWQFNWFHNVVLKKCHNGIWEDTNRTISAGTGFSYAPSMTCDDNDMLHIVWEKDYQIHYRKFNGSSFSTDIKLSNSNVYAAYPDIANSNNNLVVVWEDLRDGNFEIYLKEYSNQTWQPEIRISNSPEASLFPSISTDSTGKTHIVWQEEQIGGYKIFYTTYFNGIIDTILSCVESPGEAINPSIASKNNKSWLVWSDSRDGDWEIYWKELNAGNTEEDTRLTYSPGNSDYPDITVDNNENLFVLFCNSKDSLSTVYFKENIIKKSSENVIAGLSASPNPFFENTIIRCPSLEKSNNKQIGNSQIRIYNLSGRLIKSFSPEFDIRWNGRDETGITVKSGIYFVKLDDRKPIKLIKIK